MSTYQIGSETIPAHSEGLQDVLIRARAAGMRPRCLCTQSGVEMYLAKVGGRYIVKRMPGSGAEHQAGCESYEPPPELSGLGQVQGSAITEDAADGETTLRLGFSLSKTGGKAAPDMSGGGSDSVTTDGTKLTLRAMLHYLWEEAGFNKWVPAMAGRRNWPVIRKYLLEAASGKNAKGKGILESLYVPEPFSLDHKAEITGRRMQQMMAVASAGTGRRKLLLAVGEVKDIAATRFGHKIILKQVADCPFMINDDLHKRMLKRFEVELGLWDAVEGSHLMVIGTFAVGRTGVASFEELSLMVVTENWIPFESTFDKMVIDAMTTANRPFVKGLRYNLAAPVPLASIVATDAAPGPTALYIIAPDTDDEQIAVVDELAEDSSLASWIWNAGLDPMPELPGPAQSTNAQ
ncbi:DUF1173 domain-containing protein (plasmid) [Rhodococcus sp. ZPP]|uniref:DUF1173 domain-containing protein n=1 Tax=Rhodococcus sp. ZPP TaxID=2749906 RepID=UPI001AD86C86|nr:DUF1173 domain-containing protein [Rhodococcus sp. ZPP]QTJ71395.1 DUF1173 domain-containing protein [Rhodococcus sp. ZPP]